MVKEIKKTRTIAQVIEEMNPRTRLFVTIGTLLVIYLIVAAVGGAFPFPRPIFSTKNPYN